MIRAFSAANAEDCELHVVSGINLDDGSDEAIDMRPGEVEAGSHGLVAWKWQGRLPTA